VHFASEDDLRRDYPDFELGAVPPLGGRGDPVVVDAQLASRDAIVLEAGSHEQSVRLSRSELVRAANAEVADICRDDD
jgi:prolyl-tRNA editing enzyme YbaK/EbsC (Cys-tRNA(Pro) deacylase)